MTTVQLAKFILFVFIKGTSNRRYGYKFWEQKILFVCLKITGELPNHIAPITPDWVAYQALPKPRFTDDEAREIEAALDKFISQNP